MDEHRAKFQRLLRELFQFDCADLDFGIYRIMNYKRDVIEKFISTDLPKAIADELDRGALADQSQAAAAFRETANQIAETLGKDALDADGNLAETYHGTPLGKKYLDLQGKAAGGRGREALEATIFNHLYAFLSRYYQDGDFISKRRYSKRQKYAIPYNGEEVYLHWANHDQYYVKTAEHFHDYTFTSRAVTVHFKLTSASVEQDNVKGDKRFFLPRYGDVAWDAKAGQIVVPFEYRPLREQEQVTYGKKNQQDKIVAEAVEEIPKRLKKADEALAAVTAERHKNADGEPVTFLEHHLRQYTRRNTSDFFIHKDLKGFLSRELDFYLKNEVLNLDEMEAAGEGRTEGWFQVMRVIKAIGGRIVEFLAQIEDFQKMLWEKRKFVTETNYCITVQNVPEEFYPQIAACEAQWAEWKNLFHVDEEENNLFNSNAKSKKDKRVGFLKGYPTLVLDTKHFDQDFVDRLLASFDDLDGMTDGLLVHGENFQALNLLLEKHRETVKCVYIDPPYNTGNDEFIYKDQYQHSSWMSSLDGRLRRLAPILTEDGALFISIDDNELHNLLGIGTGVFGRDNLAALLIARTNPRGRTLDKYVAKTHEYIVTIVKGLLPSALWEIPKSEKQQAEYRYEDDHGKYRLLELRNRNPMFNRSNRPNLYYPFYVDPKTGELSLAKSKGCREEILPRNSRGEDGCWTWSASKSENNMNVLEARQTSSGKWRVFRRDYLGGEAGLATTKAKSIWLDKEINHENGKELLRSLFGSHVYDFPKSVDLVAKCIELGSSSDDWVLDFFAGSGTTAHAVISGNRTEGQTRRFMLVEMGDGFRDVIMPRVKKVTFSAEWKDGKPKRMATAEEAERSPRIVKYVRLESYEDALNNIAFTLAKGQKTLKFDDYLLKYMLQWETKESETLLNVERMATPFSYTLHIAEGQETREKTVDVPETFNYLLGLNVRTRKVYDDDGRGYLVYGGQIDHRRVVVIWRETEGWGKKDLERDKKFVAGQKLTEGADEVFVNGDSFIPKARALEPVFKNRMFSSIQ
ncbi:MAG: site-specific DNA-methyltransferase [Planctomycetota bacterium]